MQKRTRRGFIYFIVFTLLSVVVWKYFQNSTYFSFIKSGFSFLALFDTETSSPRGTFYDRNLKQVAVTLDRVAVYARTQELQSIPETVKALSEILSIDEKELEQKLESGSLRIWLAEDISREQEIAIRSRRLPGITLQKEETRYYPNGNQAAHLIGYAENGIGLAGVELYYDRLAANKKQNKKNKSNATLSQDLVLNLDLKIQDILDKMVEEIVKQSRVTSALAYVMEGRTGQIVGGSQLPGFDPNNFTKYSQEVLSNRLVMPIILPEKFRIFLREMALLYGGEDTEKYILPWSVRNIEDNLGAQLRWWDKLHFHETPVADFHLASQPGEKNDDEKKSIYPSPQTLAMVPEQATPFTLLSVMALLQNSGKLTAPFLVQKTDIEENVEELQNKNGFNGASVIGLTNSSDGIGLFRSMAHPGSSKAYLLRDEIPFTVRKGANRIMLINDLLVATFSAGGSDLTLLALVERESDGPLPKNGKKIMNLEQVIDERLERISLLQQVAKTVADVVEPDYSEDENYPGGKDAVAKGGKVSEQIAKKQAKFMVMPDLKGQSLRKSLRMLQGVHLKISIKGTGKVISQAPNPGISLKDMSDCTLVLQKAEDIQPNKLSLKASMNR